MVFQLEGKSKHFAVFKSSLILLKSRFSALLSVASNMRFHGRQQLVNISISVNAIWEPIKCLLLADSADIASRALTSNVELNTISSVNCACLTQWIVVKAVTRS